MLSNVELVHLHLKSVQKLEEILDVTGYLPVLSILSGQARVILGVAQLVVTFFKTVEALAFAKPSKTISYSKALISSTEAQMASCIGLHALANLARGFLTMGGFGCQAIVFCYDLYFNKLGTYENSNRKERWLHNFKEVAFFREVPKQNDHHKMIYQTIRSSFQLPLYEVAPELAVNRSINQAWNCLNNWINQ